MRRAIAQKRSPTRPPFAYECGAKIILGESLVCFHLMSQMRHLCYITSLAWSWRLHEQHFEKDRLEIKPPLLGRRPIIDCSASSRCRRTDERWLMAGLKVLAPCIRCRCYSACFRDADAGTSSGRRDGSVSRVRGTCAEVLSYWANLESHACGDLPQNSSRAWPLTSSWGRAQTTRTPLSVVNVCCDQLAGWLAGGTCSPPSSR